MFIGGMLINLRGLEVGGMVMFPKLLLEKAMHRKKLTLFQDYFIKIHFWWIVSKNYHGYSWWI